MFVLSVFLSECDKSWYLKDRTYDEVRAVVLICALALLALETTPDLGANTDSVALLYLLDILANLDSFSNNFVADAERTLVIAPSSGNGVSVQFQVSANHLLCLSCHKKV